MLNDSISDMLCTDAALVKALTANCYTLIELLQGIPNYETLDAADAQIQLFIATLEKVFADLEKAASEVK